MFRNNRKTWRSLAGATGALALFGATAAPPAARASSHSDAPLIKLDPQANLTDVYAFIRQRPSGQRVLVVEVSVRPFSEPGDGVMYEAFSDDARYSIHITNPATGKESQRYDFRFSPVGVNGNYKNLDTILRYGRGSQIGPIESVGDARQNFVQTYTVTRVEGNKSTVLGANLMTPPPNVGARTTPFYNDLTGTPQTNPNYGKAISGATARANLDLYTRQTTHDLSGRGRRDRLRRDARGRLLRRHARHLRLPRPADPAAQPGRNVRPERRRRGRLQGLQRPPLRHRDPAHRSGKQRLRGAVSAAHGHGRRRVRVGRPAPHHAP
jgi:hypothetical protein